MSNNTKETFLQKIHTHRELIAAIISGTIILTAWVLTNIIPHIVWIILHIIAFIIGGFAQAKEGILDTIEHKKLNVELLMVIAAIGSASIGYWTEGAILIFIFSLAGALETYTINKSDKEISLLMDLQPEEARIIENDMERMIPVVQLKINDHIFVRAGERIPADGFIVKGSSSVDESAITGESIPITKIKNDEVFAGTVALNGSITIVVTKYASETLFEKIIKMIQSAKDEKSPTQLFIEKFEGLYVNIVLITVVLMMFLPHYLFGWSWTESIYRAMILLVVASPCAVVASIMPAMLSAISNGARQGILFKGGIHLEHISHLDVIAFDKTGTLTNGTPVVTDAIVHPEYDKIETIKIVGAIENESTHPLANAITTYSSKFDLNINISVENMRTISGEGVSAYINGQIWKVGKAEFVGENEALNFQNGIANSLAKNGKTIVFASVNGKVAALFGLQDTIREEAYGAIESIKKKGIFTILLTGDNKLTANSVAKQLKLDDYIAECLPNEKVDAIRNLSKNKKKVAMVGDGINDAPALALADTGIAMGDGTDVALETADVVLIKNDLSKVMAAISLSERMNRIVKQNIFFSLFVICALIVSNFFQAIDLPLGVIGHEGSTILVIVNGLRLLR